MPEYTCKAEQCPSSEAAARERLLLECSAMYLRSFLMTSAKDR